MKVVSKNKSALVLRFERGESCPDVFIGFLKKAKIRGGFFFGLGGFIDPEVAYYDLKNKKYVSKKLKGVFEVLSLTGNVAICGRKLMIHNHVVLGNRNYKTLGGHLIQARVGATLEVYLQVFDNGLKRFYNEKTGFNLLN